MRPRTVREAEEQGQLSSPDTGRASTSLPPHPVSQVGLTPGTWLMVTVRLSGRRTSGVVTAMPPCSACRRSSWISYGRAWDQQRPWPPRHTETQMLTGLHREIPVGHQGAEAPHHRVPKTLTEPLKWTTPTQTLFPGRACRVRPPHKGLWVR